MRLEQTREGCWRKEGGIQRPNPCSSRGNTRGVTATRAAAAVQSGSRGLRPFNTAPLPNGFHVSYVSKPDVAFLTREIHQDRLYFRHGVELRPGGTVIDVGANIGMFAMHCAETVGPQGRVVALEPIPAIYASLEDNVARHHAWCSDRGAPHDVAVFLSMQPSSMFLLGVTPLSDGHPAAMPELLNCGASSYNGETSFTFYGSAAGWSTMYENASEVEEAMGVFLENSLQLPHGAQRDGPASRGLESSWLTAAAGFCMSIMDELDLRHVDLLKIDAERAELDVLRGLTPEAMRGIKQVVMEVHHVGDALEAALHVLQSSGFTNRVVDQDQQLQGSTIYNVYATRL